MTGGEIALGLLTTLCMGLATWCLRNISILREKVAVNEATDEQRSNDTDRRFKEFREDLAQLRRDQIAATKDLKKAVEEMRKQDVDAHADLRAGVAKIHADLAVVKATMVRDSGIGRTN